MHNECHTIRPQKLTQHRTTRFEQFLLIVTVSILPLQAHLPTIGGASILFILFGILGVFLLLLRQQFLFRTLIHPVFLSTYALVGIGFFMELVNNSTGFFELVRIGFMIIGGIVIASFCRDGKALLYGMYGFLIASIWLSILLFMSTYGSLSSAKVENFEEASKLRSRVFAESPIYQSPNTMAAFTAQGSVVALALALTARGYYRRYVFLGTTIFCSIATLLPMSRGGVGILLISCAAILHTYGFRHLRVLLTIVVLAIGMLLWVPDVIYKRMTFSMDNPRGEKVEGRSRVYSAAIDHLPEYLLTGVGISNFYGKWGKQSGFANSRGMVAGSHNCFTQVTLYWGLPGLLGLLTIMWQAYTCVPKTNKSDPLVLCLIGISVSVLVLSLVMHHLFAKEFSLVLGMLVGTNLWISRRRTNNPQLDKVS